MGCSLQYQDRTYPNFLYNLSRDFAMPLRIVCSAYSGLDNFYPAAKLNGHQATYISY